MSLNRFGNPLDSSMGSSQLRRTPEVSGSASGEVDREDPRHQEAFVFASCDPCSPSRRLASPRSPALLDIEEGEYPEPSLNEFQGGEDFDDEYARMAQHVEELQGMTEIDGEDL